MRIRQLADERGLPLTSTVRALARTALAAGTEVRLDQLEVVALAALMASEQSLRVIESLFPSAAQRSQELVASARVSALDRIEAVRRDLEEARPQ